VKNNKVRWLAPLVLGLAAAIAACSTEGRLVNRTSNATSGEALTQADVDKIIIQAVSQANSLQTPAVVAVTDRQGEVLGVFVMQGRDIDNDGVVDNLSEGDIQTAISKAATASAFQSEQEAFTTRTAFFIVQGHYPPNVLNTGAGPLFGVQDSGMPSSDTHVVAYDQSGTTCGTGISGVLGGVPLYKNGSPVGGIGISTVAVITSRGLANDPTLAPTLITPVQNGMDEGIARAGTRDFEAPFVIEATNLFVDGIQFPFFGTTKPVAVAEIAASSTSIAASVGAIDPRFPVRPSPFSGPFAEMRVGNQYGVGIAQRFIGRNVARTSPVFSGTFTNVDRPAGVVFDPVFYRWTNVPIVAMAQGAAGGGIGENRTPPIDSVEPPPAEGGLTQAEVLGIIDNAVANARLSVAGIRLPRGVNVVGHVAVTDVRGNVLAVYRMGDGTLFSHDIAVQKARTAAFFSTDGCAISARGIGFISQPFFPPGIGDGEQGPLCRLRDLMNRGKIVREVLPNLTIINPPPSPPSDGTTDENPIMGGFQFFNDFQGAVPAELASVRGLVSATGGFSILADRPDLNFVSPGLQTGLMTFPGGLPLYKGNRLVGAIGFSGDGVDEDDAACFNGSFGFQPPRGTRCDEVPEAFFISTVLSKIDILVAAANAHPDPRIRNVYGPLLASERTRIADRFSRSLQNVRIPFVKLPRNPTDR
jgi:uncharacterized protein GlcG (DUF336 family)